MTITLELDPVAEARLREHADAQGLSPEDAVRRLLAENTEPKRPRYSALFGAGAGMPGAYGSVEEVDRAINEMRDEWDQD